MEETLDQHEHYVLRRDGRFLVVDLQTPHQVLSTSARSGGMADGVRFLVNHQSVEGQGHLERFEWMMEIGETGYHHHVCEELGLEPEAVAMMGTAANMNYAARIVETFAELRVCAVVTAGVEGNAGCAGDPANWHETESGQMERHSHERHPHDGTINTMLLVNWPLTPGAMARAVVTMTEGKSAALRDLAVSSRYSRDLATGTGTDQYCIAAPLDDAKRPKARAGHHAKLGELIGRSVRRATMEALRWQNGLEASSTRSLYHALRRYGFKAELFLPAMKSRLETDEFAFLDKNIRSVVHDPGVSAAAYAFAAVWDRLRHGTLSTELAAPLLRQQAAVLASSVAAKPEAWPTCYEKLVVHEDALLDTVYDAIALGWRLKWT
ncbi:MAG: adenosylcobinamide amidohydrolase [Gemmatimonadetes bacterium]|nr:adenosylcobinamide amidohydrolase [Gemmatimonadota bacterium]